MNYINYKCIQVCMLSEYIHDAYTNKTHSACDAIDAEFEIIMLSCDQCPVTLLI